MIILERIPFSIRPFRVRDDLGAWRFEWCGLRIVRLTFSLDALIGAAAQQGAIGYARAIETLDATEEATHGRTLH